MSAEGEQEMREAASALGVEADELQAILEDVERVLHDLAGMDVDVNEPADLDRVRQALPTEPHRAELLSQALPHPLNEAIEYVHPSTRQSGYWRRSPERRDLSALSDAEIVRRHEFSQAAIDTRGVRGTMPTGDGREVQRNALEVGERLRGQEFDPEPDESEGDRGKGLAILQRIRDVL